MFHVEHFPFRNRRRCTTVIYLRHGPSVTLYLGDCALSPIAHLR